MSYNTVSCNIISHYYFTCINYSITKQQLGIMVLNRLVSQVTTEIENVMYLYPIQVQYDASMIYKTKYSIQCVQYNRRFTSVASPLQLTNCPTHQQRLIATCSRCNHCTLVYITLVYKCLSTFVHQSLKV